MFRFWRKRRGATAVEYALLLMLIGFSLIGALAATGRNIAEVFDSVSNRVDDVGGGTETGGNDTGGGGDDTGGGGDGSDGPGVTAYGYSVDCGHSSASCTQVTQQGGSTSQSPAGWAQCQTAPDSTQQTLLQQASLLSGAPGLAEADAVAASCSGGGGSATAYGWRVDCTDGTALCMQYSPASGASETDLANCGTGATSAQQTILAGSGLVVPQDGQTPESLTASCSAADLTYGWLASCMSNGETGFGCYSTGAAMQGVRNVADARACESYTPKSGDDALLTAAGLMTAAARDSYQGDCSADPDGPPADYYYGYRLSCSSGGNAATCTQINSIDETKQTVSSTNCQSDQSQQGQDWTTAAGLLPGASGLTPTAAAAHCDDDPDMAYGWQVTCFGGGGPFSPPPPTCYGVSASDPSNPVEVESWRCSGYTPTGADATSRLTDGGLLTDAQLQDYDWNNCSVEATEPAKWRLVLDSGSSYCHQDLLVEQAERWACVRDDVELTGVAAGACPISDRRMAPYWQQVGWCEERYHGMQWKPNGGEMCDSSETPATTVIPNTEEGNSYLYGGTARDPSFIAANEFCLGVGAGCCEIYQPTAGQTTYARAYFQTEDTRPAPYYASFIGAGLKVWLSDPNRSYYWDESIVWSPPNQCCY